MFYFDSSLLPVEVGDEIREMLKRYVEAGTKRWDITFRLRKKLVIKL